MTAETTGQASPGEASFQLLAEHLPDLIIFAFDADLRMWAATGGGLRARGWTSEDFIGMTVPEIAGATRAEDIQARCEAALTGQRTQLEMAGYDPPDRLRLGASSSPEADELLWQVTKDLSAEVTSLRRTIGRLRPLVLVEDGLEAALREEAKSACNRAALASCEVTSELDGRLDPVVETALFRVAQQALANVVDHAGATHALLAIERWEA